MGVTFTNGKHYEISSIPNITGLNDDALYTFVIFEETLTKLEDGTYAATMTAVKVGYDVLCVMPPILATGNGYSAVYASGVAINPYSLVDGDSSTYFSYGGNNQSTAGAGVIINFPSILNIEKLTLNNYNVGYAFDSGSGQYWSPSVHVYFSADSGTSWSAPITKSLTGHGTLNILEFDQTQANAIKLHFNAGAGYGSNGSYAMHSAGLNVNNLSIFHRVTYAGGRLTEDIKEPESPVDGDLWLDLSRSPHMPYIWQNGVKIEKQFVKQGEDIKTGETLGTPVSYAFNGKYTSELITQAATTAYSRNHNIGVNNKFIKTNIFLINKTSELGYSVGDRVEFISNNAYPASLDVTKLLINQKTGTSVYFKTSHQAVATPSHLPTGMQFTKHGGLFNVKTSKDS